MGRLDIRWRIFAICAAATLMMTGGLLGCSSSETAQEKEEEKEHEYAAELHQMCAAAGQTEDGEMTALNCFGPQDPSGKTSTSGDLEWQPGAFHVVSQ